MNTKFSSILIYLIISNPLAFVSSHTLYYVTTIASAIQDSTASGTQDSISTISKTFAGYRKYGNISIHAKTVEYSRTSGLAQLISTVSSVSSSSLTAKDGKEVLHLSQVIKKRKNILKEIYWNRTLRSSDITKCSQVFLLQLCNSYEPFDSSSSPLLSLYSLVLKKLNLSAKLLKTTSFFVFVLHMAYTVASFKKLHCLIPIPCNNNYKANANTSIWQTRRIIMKSVTIACDLTLRFFLK